MIGKKGESRMPKSWLFGGDFAFCFHLEHLPERGRFGRSTTSMTRLLLEASAGAATFDGAGAVGADVLESLLASSLLDDDGTGGGTFIL